MTRLRTDCGLSKCLDREICSLLSTPVFRWLSCKRIVTKSVDPWCIIDYRISMTSPTCSSVMYMWCVHSHHIDISVVGVRICASQVVAVVIFKWPHWCRISIDNRNVILLIARCLRSYDTTNCHHRVNKGSPLRTRIVIYLNPWVVDSILINLAIQIG